jgi:hypothetical protein
VNAENWTETRLYNLIKARCQEPAWAVLPQVGNATGTQQRRWADAVAMSLWPSRGLELHGFEIKVSKSDWKKELALPEKAEEIAVYCDRWWIVAAPDVVERDTLPPTWGLLEPVKRKRERNWQLRAKKEASKLDAKPMDRGFLAALLRRVYEHDSPDVLLAKAKAEIEQKAREAGRVVAMKAHASSMKRHDALLEHVNQFEQASGLYIRYEHDVEGLGAAVRAVRAGAAAQQQQLVTIRETAVRVLTACNRGLATLRYEEEDDQ